MDEKSSVASRCRFGGHGCLRGMGGNGTEKTGLDGCFPDHGQPVGCNRITVDGRLGWKRNRNPGPLCFR